MRRSEVKLLVFLVFLLFGFIVDAGAWYLRIVEAESLLDTIVHFLYDIYSPVEAVFFFWYISKIAIGKVRISAKYAMYAMLPLWVILSRVLPGLSVDLSLSFFDLIYNVGVSFMAGITLLHFIEKDSELFSNSNFWPLAGIFVYNLSTFFIMLLKYTEFAEQLWFLHDTINIISYLFFAVGFWAYRRMPLQPE